MGAGQSSQIHPPHGLHVLRVTPSSPASQTNIQPFFDFIVGFEGDTLSTDNNIDVSELERIVESNEGRILNLIVWNSKEQQTRVVPIVPSRAWSQPHFDVDPSHKPDPNLQPSLLGLSMRMCEPESAIENVWHVLDVLEGSPAESAGLVPMGDWILGWSGGVLSAENDFYDLVEAHVDKPLRVYVYSHDFDTLREVVLIPNRHWGGEGLLGCVFGFGLLHRIPPQSADRQPGMIPLELQEGIYEDQELFVPADVEVEHQHSPKQLAEWRQQEQEQWTRETLARSMRHQQTGLPRVDAEDSQQQSFSQYETPRRTLSPNPSNFTPVGLSMNDHETLQHSSAFHSPRHSTVDMRQQSPLPWSQLKTLTPTLGRQIDGEDEGSLSATETEATSRGSLTSVD